MRQKRVNRVDGDAGRAGRRARRERGGGGVAAVVPVTHWFVIQSDTLAAVRRSRSRRGQLPARGSSLAEGEGREVANQARATAADVKERARRGRPSGTPPPPPPPPPPPSPPPPHGRWRAASGWERGRCASSALAKMGRGSRSRASCEES